MAKRHGRFSSVFIDAVNASGLVNTASLALSADTAEVTNFASGGNKEYLEGALGGTANWTGFWDNADDGFDEVMYAAISTQGDDHYFGIYTHLAASLAAADPGYEMVFRWTGQPRELDVGNALMLNGDMQLTGIISRGGVNFTGAITASGAKTGINHGATAADTTLVVTYRVISVSGAGSIAIALEESSDDAATDPYAAIAALASGTLTGTGVTRKTTVAATEAWKRINVTTFSGFTSVTALVTITASTT
jgi:hypothetical protein